MLGLGAYLLVCPTDLIAADILLYSTHSTLRFGTLELRQNGSLVAYVRKAQDPPSPPVRMVYALS